MERDARLRIAVISLHTSPTDQPGAGDSGGMNVYIRSTVERLVERGVAMDIFTRCAGGGMPEVTELGPLARVIQIPAGPCAPVPKGELPALLRPFTRSLLARAGGDGASYDLVQTHYWLSGWVGRQVRRRWRRPQVALFHTLAKVKNLSVAEGDVPEPEVRIRGEEWVVDKADRILTPTPSEAIHLRRLYGARGEQIRVVSPGVDTERFRPRPKGPAKAALGLQGRRVILFAGRLQRMKGPDVAVRTVGELASRGSTSDVVLAIVGAGSLDGSITGDGRELLDLARRLGVEDRVRLFPPRPHGEVPSVYAAADAVVMPSRSESFGMVALEAQACGVPVVAARVGGLCHVVDDGRTGYLVDDHDPSAYADHLERILGNAALADRLSRQGRDHAARFGWEATSRGMLEVYRELVRARSPE